MSPVTSRRTVFKVLGTGLLAGPALIACQSAEATVRHPALRAPSDAVLLTAVDLAATADRGRKALLELLGRIDAHPDQVMVGLGASLFDHLQAPSARPAALTPMPPFTGDVLDPDRVGGDVLLHVEGDDAPARTAEILHETSTFAVRWQVAGHRTHNEVRHDRPLMRNPFGFTEGHANAASSSADAAANILVPKSAGQPAWMSGGSLLAVRMVRLAHALWDADDAAKQARIIGRRPDGTWLDGRPPTSDPDFRNDPEGVITPLDSHVRMVNPRTPGVDPPRMLRRSWAYLEQAGDGILFMAYQADYRTGFERAQRRLQSASAVEAMTPYVLAVGGGYFAVPARRPGEGWEKALFGAS